MEAVVALVDDAIQHVGKPIAVVVAEPWEQAQHAAALVRAEYQPGQVRGPLETRLNEAYPPRPFFGGITADYVRGDPGAALGAAGIRVEQTYTKPVEHHNPMEPPAAIAVWHGAGELTVYDTTQGAAWSRQGLAEALELAADKVRVICPFVGGGFGAKGGTWPYTVLAALAARHVGRPVKLVLTRAQMYTSVGYRSQTLQELHLGALPDGTLTAITHASTSIGSDVGENPEPAPEVTKILYACPNLETHLRLVQLDLGVPTSMRAPGEAPGTFALESAMDELAVALDIDPIDLRLRNSADTAPASAMPWSSNGLRECYAQGAERFDWARRNPRPRSMRDGRWLVGWGMATASYPTYGFPAQAAATITADGRAVVRSATADLGTGQYTVMTQVAADALGLPPDQVKFELGDSDMPYAFVAGGSSGVRSVGPAVRAACGAARAKLLTLATSEDESYASILARHGLAEVTGEGSVDSVDAADGHRVNAFGAQFVEGRVDADLGLVRVSRALGVFDIGQGLNPKTARSQ